VAERARGALWAVLQTSATSVVLAAVTLGGSILAARLLGPSGRGELAEAQVIPSLVGSLGLIGMSEAAVYFAASRRADSARIVATALAVGLFSTGLVLFAVLLTVNYLGDRVTEAFETYALIIPLMAFVGIPHSSLRALLQFDLWNRLRVIPPLIWIFALMAGFLLSGITVLDLLRIQIIATCVYGCFQFWLITRDLPGKFELDRSCIAPMLAFGVATVTSQLPQLASVRVDQLLVTSAFSAERVGHYFVALGWSAIPGLLLQAAGSIAFPKMASIADAAHMETVITRLARTSVAAAFVVSIPALALTPVAIPFLYGEQFRESIQLALILTVASAVRGAAQVLQEAARGLGHVSAIIRSEFCGLLVMVVLIWPLQSRYGLVGVAVTAVVASFASLWMVAFFIRVKARCSWTRLLVPTTADVRLIWTEIRRIAGFPAS
jgi:antigen flippase